MYASWQSEWQNILKFEHVPSERKIMNKSPLISQFNLIESQRFQNESNNFLSDSSKTMIYMHIIVIS